MSVVEKLIIANKEHLLNSFLLMLIPLNQKGIRLAGKLFVTNEHLYFDVHIKESIFELLNKVIKKANKELGQTLSLSQSIIRKWKDDGYVTIPKSEIEDIKEEKSILRKSIILMLSDKSQFLIDRGILSISSIKQTIQLK